MTTLTIEIPEEEKDLFLQIIKKFNAKVVNSSYNAEFVSEIVKGIEEKNQGKKGLKVDLENLWK
ncbi:hypothetical protein A5893_10145 [Pedobacter psychrophilus]|uniref:Uncharacterized protein n=1 Tax=Pedobacter psychrophilus TaxID=1826909 RepID=A0A179DGA1_9SPHI|nr:hypothetical protein [Pedobacter psychrophilus]OAQ39914.1 hypothetical protein A5893_10145 [Pedobacter psychrophilus]